MRRVLHVQNYDNNTEKLIKKLIFDCSYCGDVFDEPISLSLHIAEFHDVRPSNLSVNYAKRNNLSLNNI